MIVSAIVTGAFYKNPLPIPGFTALQGTLTPEHVAVRVLSDGTVVAAAYADGAVYLRAIGDAGGNILDKPFLQVSATAHECKPYISADGTLYWIESDFSIASAPVDVQALLNGTGSPTGQVTSTAWPIEQPTGEVVIVERTTGGTQVPCYIYRTNCGYNVLFDEAGNTAGAKTQIVSSGDNVHGMGVDMGQDSLAVFVCDSDGQILARTCDVGYASMVTPAHTPDVSTLRLTDAFRHNGKSYVVGIYKRTEDYDDGLADVVILPVVQDKWRLFIALPPYALAYSGSDPGPVAVAVSAGKLWFTTFTGVATCDIPHWIDPNAAVGVSLQEGDVASLAITREAASGTTVEMTLATFNRTWDVEPVDFFELTLDAGPKGTLSLSGIVHSVTDAQRGATKNIVVRGADYPTFSMTQTRLPHYYLVANGEHGIAADLEAEDLLYPVSHNQEVGVQFLVIPLDRTTVGTWPMRFTGSTTVAFDSPVDVTLSDSETYTITLLGWSRNDTGANPMLTLYATVRTGDGSQRISLGSGQFKDTYMDTTPNAPNYISMTVSGLSGIVERWEIVCDDAAGGSETVIAAIYIDGNVKIGIANNVLPFETDKETHRKKLVKPNVRGVLLSTTPFSPKQFYFITEFYTVVTSQSVMRGTLAWGFIFGAKDADNGNLVYIQRDLASGNATLVFSRLRDGIEEVLHTTDPGSLNTFHASPALQIADGVVRVLDTLNMTNFPGLLVAEFEWPDDDFMPFDVRHVGVVAWRSADGVRALGEHPDGLYIASAAGLPSSGKIQFPGGRVFEYTSIEDLGPIDGPWQLRNIYKWASKYSDNGNSGWAVEFLKLEWDEPGGGYIGQTVTVMPKGYKWSVRAVDTTPFITTSGQRVDLPNRIRMYSNDISGNESVSIEDACWLGGAILKGSWADKDGYVTPGEVGFIVGDERIEVGRVFAIEETFGNRDDVIAMLVALSGETPQRNVSLSSTSTIP